MSSDLMTGARFLWSLRGYVRDTLTLPEAEAQIRAQLRQRESSFLQVMRQGVFDHEPSPYRKLMAHCGISYQDVAGWVQQCGVQGALGALYDAGVYLTLDQFKGRTPIERSGFALVTRSADFDSPILTSYFAAETGGSGGMPRRIRVDLEALAYEAAYNLIAARRLGQETEPYAMWRPIPPAAAGFKDVLRRSRAGLPVNRWFSQTDPRVWRDKQAAFTGMAVRLARTWGADVAQAEHVPLERADIVARWMAEQTAAGRPAHVSMSASSAVRVCTAAQKLGLNISGALFRVGGEPHTAAKEQILADAGARGVNHYSMSEVGRIGLTCGNPDALDHVHLVTDKLALIERPAPGRPDDEDVPAFYLTTLLPMLPKIMLNVETGDHGVVEERRCGCPWSELGLTTCLHTIRSYDKLTTEGMHFTGTDLMRLVEEVLPQRFGGAPSDYQLVEQEIDGLTRVSVVVSPRVGAIDDAAVIETAMQALASRDVGTGMMAEIWKQAKTLRVERREPYMTSSAKILPLHVRRDDS
jgi:hypothetical protein